MTSHTATNSPLTNSEYKYQISVKPGTNIVLEEASPRLLHLLIPAVNKDNMATVRNSGLERH